ncbi:MAG: Lrp/AsnC family transcriptional regulator [Cytophagales bacterium]|nr:Lrp/AsnC family transcriptional regulator [Cytophagales bacterium]
MIDNIDHKILNILQKNGRITNAGLASEIGLSPASTLERVRKLEDSGIIKSYHAKLDTNKLGLGIIAFIQVKLVRQRKDIFESFIGNIVDFDEIIECFHTTGSCDFILKITTRDMNSFQELLVQKLGEIEEIEKMETMVILSTYKDGQIQLTIDSRQ